MRLRYDSIASIMKRRIAIAGRHHLNLRIFCQGLSYYFFDSREEGWLGKIGVPILDRHHEWRSLDPTLDISSTFVKKKKKKAFRLLFSSFASFSI